MANELSVMRASGATIWAAVREIATSKVWSIAAGAFVTWANADVADYAIALAEQGGGLYDGDLPAGLSASTAYRVTYYVQAGAAPAVTDEIAGSSVGATAAPTGTTAGDLTAGDVLERARMILMDEKPGGFWTDEDLLKRLDDGVRDLLGLRGNLRIGADGKPKTITSPTALTDVLAAPISCRARLAYYVAAQGLLESDPDKSNLERAAMLMKLYTEG